MNKLITYIRKEGFGSTLKKIYNKVFSHIETATIFFRANSIVEIEDQNNEIEVLTEVNSPAFITLKFWDFIVPKDYINNIHQSVIMLKKEDEYIAYVAEEHEIKRDIHNLGSFTLKDSEGWIGPIYVRKKHRGKGYSHQLIYEQIKRLEQIGITSFYTAINSQNINSQRAFRTLGFTEIGTVDAKGNIINDPENILCDKFTRKGAL